MIDLKNLKNLFKKLLFWEKYVFFFEKLIFLLENKTHLMLFLPKHYPSCKYSLWLLPY
jgi:hypothetical protein